MISKKNMYKILVMLENFKLDKLIKLFQNKDQWAHFFHICSKINQYIQKMELKISKDSYKKEN